MGDHKCLKEEGEKAKIQEVRKVYYGRKEKYSGAIYFQEPKFRGSLKN